LDKKPLFFIT